MVVRSGGRNLTRIWSLRRRNRRRAYRLVFVFLETRKGIVKNRLSPFDLVVALRLLSGADKFAALAADLGASLSQVHKSVQTLEFAQLLRPGTREVNRIHLGEFLIHGARYAFPARPGVRVIGVPTAHSARDLINEIKATEAYVWPSADGEVIGSSIEPLYAGAPKLRERSPETYRLLTLFDALRVGSSRERRLARTKLETALAHRPVV